jgi:hypothetical protein
VTVDWVSWHSGQISHDSSISWLAQSIDFARMPDKEQQYDNEHQRSIEDVRTLFVGEQVPTIMTLLHPIFDEVVRASDEDHGRRWVESN